MRHLLVSPRDMLNRMHGTKQRARKLRGVELGVGLGFVVMGATLWLFPNG